MTHATTHGRLQVSPDRTGPYIDLPQSQVDEVKELLDRNHIFYWVDEDSISINGGPYMTTINLGRNGNAAAVQSLLDSIG